MIALSRFDALSPGFVRPAELSNIRISFSTSMCLTMPASLALSSKSRTSSLRFPAFLRRLSSAVPMDGDNRSDNVFAADHTYAQGAASSASHLLFISPDI